MPADSGGLRARIQNLGSVTGRVFLAITLGIVVVVIALVAGYKHAQEGSAASENDFADIAEVDLPTGAEHYEGQYEAANFFGERTLFASFELDSAELTQFLSELQQKGSYRAKSTLKPATDAQLQRLLSSACRGYEAIDLCEEWKSKELTGGFAAGDLNFAGIAGFPIMMVAVESERGKATVYLSAGEF